MRAALVLVAAVSFAAVAAAAQPAPPEIGQVSKDSVWVPTPELLIRRMLQIADVTREDLVVDLGAGDGRIAVYAARHFGARAIGVELEENLVQVSIESAKAQGVAHLARFVRQDLFEFDLSDATVIALYISPGAMSKLKPRLLKLAPGTRVVSHQFTLEGWEPDETIRVGERSGYLWVVPADVRGDWTVRTGGDALQVKIEQDHQQLKVRGARAGRAVPVLGVRLRGTEIAFSTFDPDGGARQYRGRVDGARMNGESDGHGVRPADWSATRH